MSDSDQPPLTARELILALVDSTAAESLSARYLVAAGSLFDIDPGTIRTALARLVRTGILVISSRGRYAPGPHGDAVKSLARNWSQVEGALTPWSGAWLAVFIAHIGRTDKTRVRANERALRLLGFAEADAGLWVRPANLRRTSAALRKEMLALGLDRNSRLAEVSTFEPRAFLDPERLWNTRQLERCYHDNIRMLEDSTARLDHLSDEAAARETLLIGRRVTRDILLDPLLPDELADAGARRAMIEAMRSYDKVGRRLWRAFYVRHEKSGL